MATVVEEMRFMLVLSRLRFGIRLLQLLNEVMGEVHELEPGVGPELLAVLDSINETSAAMGRAADFLNARLEVSKEEA